MARFGILVGGGPAPGINGVIGAATIVARRSGAERDRAPRGLPLAHGGEHRPHAGARRGGRRGHPPPGRLDPADVAREPDEEAGAPRGGREGARRARRRPPDHDRRRRHRVLGAPLSRGGGRARAASRTCRRRSTTICRCPTACRPSASRPRASTRRASSRASSRTRAPTGRWLRRRDDGPHGGAPRARRRQGGGRHARPDPRGVRRAADPPREDRAHSRGRDREARAPGRPRRRRRARGRARAAKLDPADLESLADAPRDEHGHVRLAEVPLGSVVQDAVAKSLAARRRRR